MAQREDPRDILLVKNIDLNCSDIEESVIPILRNIRQPDGKVISKEQNYTFSNDHKDYFEVRYEKKGYRLKPGETKAMPRTIAEHFANHLANHILQKQEIAEITTRDGIKIRPSYVRNPSRRMKTLRDILIGVESYYLGDVFDYQDETDPTAGDATNYDAKVNSQLGEIVAEEGGLNLGLVGKPMYMGLDAHTMEMPAASKVESETIDKLVEQERSVAEAISAPEVDIAKIAAVETTKVSAPKFEEMSKPQLIAQAMSMAIEVTGKESKEELIAIIGREMGLTSE